MSFPIENRHSLLTKASCAVKVVLEISFAINKYALSHLEREKLLVCSKISVQQDRSQV